MGSNPTQVEVGKIVELGDSIFLVQSIFRASSGDLRSFTATVLLRDPDEDDDAGSVVGMEVYDESLLDVYTIH
jgi:hypothetical protein